MPEIEVAAAVGVEIASKADLTAMLREHHEQLTRHRAGRYRVLSGNSVATGNPAVVPIDRAPAGRMWRLEWVSAFQADTPSAPALANANATVCVGTWPTALDGTLPAGYRPADDAVVLPGLLLPFGVSMPRRTFVRPGQAVFVVFQGTGIVNGLNLSANCGVIGLPDTAEAVLW